ncbi:MAG: hypothetical protein GF317_14145 [Candidatus Lokiarchaeota archaeon]|nr:hypothetical protein [Candidatus Lokiarchaeota archaeon]MBD3200757.1 hypothetical protein [Candidatus Lokiarchaeota archaeon]
MRKRANMNLNPKYLIYHDLIGLRVYAKPKHYNKKKNFSDIGRVINDTENMLITKIEDEVKKYIKKEFIFRIEIPDKKKRNKINILEVDGEKLVGRPENRLRSLKKKRRFIK